MVLYAEHEHYFEIIKEKFKFNPNLIPRNILNDTKIILRWKYGYTRWVLVPLMCKVHANINYFLLYYEMKYDIKPNLQLIVILFDMLCLNYWKYIYKNREEIMDVMWNIRKEEKWILILRVNALFLEKWNQTSLLSLLHLYYTPFFDNSRIINIFFIYLSSFIH